MTVVCAEAISALGSQVSLIALPLVAVVSLHASALEMGVLRGAAGIATAITGLAAGAFLGRLRAKPTMVSINLVGAVTLATVPVLAGHHFLSEVQLACVSFVTAGLAAAGWTTLVRLIPNLVPADQLPSANGIFAATVAGAPLFGPALAGLLMSLAGPTQSVAVDALSFAIAASLFLTLRVSSPSLGSPPPKDADRIETFNVVAIVRRSVDLSMLVICFGLLSMAGAAMNTLTPLLMVGQLGLTPAAFSLAIVPAGAGLLVGSLVAGRLVQHIGLRAHLLLSLLLVLLAIVGVSAVARPFKQISWIFATCNFLAGSGSGLVNAVAMTRIQVLVRSERIAAVSGFYISVVGIVTPVAALAAGAGGNLLGLRTTLLLFAVALGLGLLALLPLRRQRDVPPVTERKS